MQLEPDWPALAMERGTLFGAHDVLGYNPVQLRRYWSYMRVRTPLPVYYNASVIDVPTLRDVRLFGVRYLVVPTGITPPVEGSVVDRAQGYDLVEVDRLAAEGIGRAELPRGAERDRYAAHDPASHVRPGPARRARARPRVRADPRRRTRRGLLRRGHPRAGAPRRARDRTLDRGGADVVRRRVDGDRRRRAGGGRARRRLPAGGRGAGRRPRGASHLSRRRGDRRRASRRRRVGRARARRRAVVVAVGVRRRRRVSPTTTPGDEAPPR